MAENSAIEAAVFAVSRQECGHSADEPSQSLQEGLALICGGERVEPICQGAERLDGFLCVCPLGCDLGHEHSAFVGVLCSPVGEFGQEIFDSRLGRLRSRLSRLSPRPRLGQRLAHAGEFALQPRDLRVNRLSGGLSPGLGGGTSGRTSASSGTATRALPSLP
jgi:hypothetical protein